MTPKCPDCKRDQDDCICASPASAPEGWKHSCNALCLDGVELWIPQCPHCGKPAPTPPVSEDRKDAERYLWLMASDFDIFGSPHAIHLSGKELDQAIDAEIVAMQEDKP